MGIYDRDYMGGGSYYGSGGMTMTNKLLLANFLVYLVTFSGTGLADTVSSLFVMQPSAVLGGEVWRLFTATYMHASFWGHLFFNMLVLFFLGPAVEQVWGQKKFFLVYTVCGLAGNVALTALSMIGYIDPGVLALGASGCILGVLGAAAVMFPRAQIYLFFMFPMPLRVAALLFAGLYVFNMVGMGANYGGDVCHLIGLGIGAAWAKLS